MEIRNTAKCVNHLPGHFVNHVTLDTMAAPTGVHIARPGVVALYSSRLILSVPLRSNSAI